MIRVKNIRDFEVNGIKPGEVVDVPPEVFVNNTYSLQKSNEELTNPPALPEKPKVEEPKESSEPIQIEIPKGTTKAIMIQAFEEAVGGGSRAALLCSMTQRNWVNWQKKPRSCRMTYSEFLELLDELEKPIFISRVIELCQAKVRKSKSKKTTAKRT